MKHKTIKTVYNKLAKEKTDLKTHKVDLSLLDGLDYLEDIQSFEDEVSRISYSPIVTGKLFLLFYVT